MPLQIIHHGGVLCLAALVLCVAHAHAEELEPLFKNPLVLVEICHQEKYDASNDSSIPSFHKNLMVHNVRAKVVKVFDGPETLVGLEFPLTGAGWRRGEIGEDEQWVSNAMWHEPVDFGVVMGSRMVMHLVKAEDYEYPVNLYNFPIGSVFVSAQEDSSFSDKAEDTKPFETRLEWAEMVQKIAEAQDPEDRLKLLVENLSNPNRMISTMSVHLLERFYPEKAIPLFEKAVFAPQVAFAARLAMDHELILAKGREWVEANNEKLSEALQAAEDFDESMFRGRESGLRLGIWFHRERQIRQPPPLELRGQ